MVLMAIRGGLGRTNGGEGSREERGTGSGG